MLIPPLIFYGIFAYNVMFKGAVLKKCNELITVLDF